jgi:hypothetical protein
MEERKVSSTQPALMYGLILGVVLIFFSLVMFLLDMDRESPFQYISYLLMVVVLFMIMVNFRDKKLNGVATYQQMFGVGFKTVLFGAILTSIFTYIFVTVIDTGMIDEILMEAENKMMENEDLSDEQIDQALNFTESFVANPIALTIWSFGANIIFGTIISLIIAIFAKREK